MGRPKKWFKSFVAAKKSKEDPSKKHDEDEKVSEKPKLWQKKKGSEARRSFYRGRFESYGELREEKAAIFIQTQFRGYLARKALLSLKGMVRLKALVHDIDTKRQASAALHSMQYWIRLQTQIQSRRTCMVAEAKVKQKKREHQMKLEAELHGLEADWLDGSETMEEIIARVHHREEAAIKRERSLAYAFKNQWRPNSKTNRNIGYEFDNTSWGWSWLDRWIASRPWENRLLLTANGKDSTKRNISSNLKNSLSNGKDTTLKKAHPMSKSNDANTHKDHGNGTKYVAKRVSSSETFPKMSPASSEMAKKKNSSPKPM
eukprot:TRINITY_DN4290_c0_g1_i2.p1 TRINITY_DN4290_c0_g1~~TRINITY_DN4290_c0_g1_i2.p1  ORF type:complete len:317 (+),score=69.64 TRINITY_DN4290_c0_g1_i2:762-1712(+)